MTPIVDLRSDTVTKPCSNMRTKMCSAEVGDDMVGEDPSINELQQLVENILGKESALFVPSATMANQLAVKSHTSPGDSIAMLKNAHIYCYESGASPLISGVTILPTGNDAGIITTEEIENLIAPVDPHFAPLTLVCLENTYSGTVVPLETIKQVHHFCKEKGLKIHLDGARIFNASVASGIDVKEYAQYCDTITICLSKGLGAPVGALICGDSNTIAKAHRFRKLMGGAMRQAGILAAAGIYALKNNIPRLAEDHKRAKEMATKLSEIPNVKVLREPQTNMVFADFSQLGIDALSLQKQLLENNIKIFIDSKKCISRLVTHLDVNSQGIDHFVSCIRLLQSTSK